LLVSAYSQDAGPIVSAKARQIHESALVVDTACRYSAALLDENFDIGIDPIPKITDTSAVDKAKAAQIFGAEFFSIWVEPEDETRAIMPATRLISSIPSP